MVAALTPSRDYRLGRMPTLTEIREKAGLSGPELARRVGAAAPEIWRLERWPAKGGRRMTVQWAERLAPQLGVSPKDLLFSETAPQPFTKVKSIHVRGEVAANKWLEQYEFVDDELPPVPAVPGRFESIEQYSFRVTGPCMDLRRIFSGDFVICVNYFDARASLTDGDIVIVERRRGQLLERTCKELKTVDGGFELWPRSTNPNFQTPISVKSRLDPQEEDGTSVEVVALVIGRYSPF